MQSGVQKHDIPIGTMKCNNCDTKSIQNNGNNKIGCYTQKFIQTLSLFFFSIEIEVGGGECFKVGMKIVTKNVKEKKRICVMTELLLSSRFSRFVVTVFMLPIKIVFFFLSLALDVNCFLPRYLTFEKKRIEWKKCVNLT
jgi:hypothetical protein